MMDSEGAYPCYVCDDVFETGRNRAAHIQIHDDTELREGIIEATQSLAEKLERQPTKADFQAHGMSIDLYRNHFGTRAKLLIAADIDGSYSCFVCEATFDSIRSRGIHSQVHDTSELRSAFVDRIRALAVEQESVPTISEAEEVIGFSRGFVHNHFEGWGGVLEKAGVSGEYECPLCGVGAATRRQRGQHIDSHHPEERVREIIIASIKEIGADIGRSPSKEEYRERGPVTPQYAEQLFGSWADAVIEAGYTPLDNLIEEREWESDSFRYGIGWNEAKRLAVRERDGFECTECGMSQKKHKERWSTRLEVHHKTPAKAIDDQQKRNAMDNLRALCKPCHGSIEMERMHAASN